MDNPTFKFCMAGVNEWQLTRGWYASEPMGDFRIAYAKDWSSIVLKRGGNFLVVNHFVPASRRETVSEIFLNGKKTGNFIRRSGPDWYLEIFKLKDLKPINNIDFYSRVFVPRFENATLDTRELGLAINYVALLPGHHVLVKEALKRKVIDDVNKKIERRVLNKNKISHACAEIRFIRSKGNNVFEEYLYR